MDNVDTRSINKIKAELHTLLGKLSGYGYNLEVRKIREILDNIQTEGEQSNKRLLVD